MLLLFLLYYRFNSWSGIFQMRYHLLSFLVHFLLLCLKIFSVGMTLINPLLCLLHFLQSYDWNKSSKTKNVLLPLLNSWFVSSAVSLIFWRLCIRIIICSVQVLHQQIRGLGGQGLRWFCWQRGEGVPNEGKLADVLLEHSQTYNKHV